MTSSLTDPSWLSRHISSSRNQIVCLQQFVFKKSNCAQFNNIAGNLSGDASGNTPRNIVTNPFRHIVFHIEGHAAINTY